MKWKNYEEIFTKRNVYLQDQENSETERYKRCAKSPHLSGPLHKAPMLETGLKQVMIPSSNTPVRRIVLAPKHKDPLQLPFKDLDDLELMKEAPAAYEQLKGEHAPSVNVSNILKIP